MTVTTNQLLGVREQFVVRAVEKQLASIKFPFDRITVEVVIDCTAVSVASHKLEIRINGNRATGSVTLTFNSVYLYQDPEGFINESIPHQLAHILSDIDGQISGMEANKPHGEEWRQWFYKISPRTIPLPAGSKLFDSRAIAIYKGGVHTACGCEGLDSIKVFSSKTSTRKSQVSTDSGCPVCEAKYQPIEYKALPKALVAECEYIKKRASSML